MISASRLNKEITMDFRKRIFLRVLAESTESYEKNKESFLKDLMENPLYKRPWDRKRNYEPAPECNLYHSLIRELSHLISQRDSIKKRLSGKPFPKTKQEALALSSYPAGEERNELANFIEEVNQIVSKLNSINITREQIQNIFEYYDEWDEQALSGEIPTYRKLYRHRKEDPSIYPNWYFKPELYLNQ